MPTTQPLSSSQFDSNNGNGGQPVAVTSTTVWQRVITLKVDALTTTVGMDIAPLLFPVKLRLTRSSKLGETHGLLQTDMTQVGKYVTLATVNPIVNTGGTVNQPNAGDIVCLNINPEGCAEIGLEALMVSSAATVRAYGGYVRKVPLSQ